jgi:hypothetical protein
MKIIKSISEFLKSRNLTNSILRDIRKVDGSKFFHPILEKGSERYNQLQGMYGYTKVVDGKTVIDPDHPFEDMFFYCHPDLPYRICNYAFFSCKEGCESITNQYDSDRIANALYKRKK